MTPAWQTEISRKAVIAKRFDTSFEACYWQLSVPDYKYREGAQIEVSFKKTVRGNYYLYAGNSRHNATAVISQNKSASVSSTGPGYYVSASDGVIVVFQTRSNVYKGVSKKYGGSGMFSYRVIGETYLWWEKPFLGRHPAYFFAAAGSIATIILMILLCWVGSCVGCCKSKKDGGIPLDHVMPLPEMSMEPSQEKSITNLGEPDEHTTENNKRK